MDNDDVVREMLLHLPLKPLLRFRTVSKFWRDVIDSPSFKSLHAQHQLANRNEDDDEDKVLLQFNFIRDKISKLSMIVFQDKGKSLSYNDFPALEKFFNDGLNPSSILTASGRQQTRSGRFVRIVGPVNGLICIHHRQPMGPIAVCNPSLGQIYELPLSPTCSCGHECSTSVKVFVGICFDDVAQDYKVVQLLSCRGHRGLHASIYSRGMNSWRELAGDRVSVLEQDLYVKCSIKLSCKNGSFCHWHGIRVVGGNEKHVIVSFDVKNEVFWTMEMPDYQSLRGFGGIKIFAKGEDSFVLFIYHKFDISDINGAKGTIAIGICEERFEVGENNERLLRWDYIKNFGPFSRKSLPTPKALWKKDCVVLQHEGKLKFFDYCDQEYVDCFKISGKRDRFKIFEYRGSFISP